MAKSLRSKREKRLRTIRREIVEPFYDKKEAAKLAVQEAALAAPKLPVRTPVNADEPSTAMDVEVAEGGSSQGVESKSLLKPVGGVSKRQLKKLKLKKGKRHGKGKGKIRKSHHI